MNPYESILNRYIYNPNYYNPINPSSLGSRQEQARQRRLSIIKGPQLPFPVYKKNRLSGMRFPPGTMRGEDPILQSGIYRHRQYQSMLGAYDVPEYETPIDILGSRGSIDVYRGVGSWFNRMTGNTMIEEVKSVDLSYLNQMVAPKPSAISQINAYMHQMRETQGRITYVARQDYNQQRSFDVNYDPGRLISDIQARRQEQLYPGLVDESSYTMEPISPIVSHYGRHVRKRPYRKVNGVPANYIGSRSLLYANEGI